MKIKNEFQLGLPVDEAFALLLDLEKVVPCMPGAELGKELDGGDRVVNVTVKLGPMRFVYDGMVRITEQEPAEHTATMVGEGKEKRGGGTAAATIQMMLSESETGARVATVADVKLTGRAARNGRGIVEDVSRTLIREMAQTLEERYGAGQSVPANDQAATPAQAADLQASPTPRPIRGGRLFFSVLWQRIKRLLGRGSPD